MYRGMIIRKTSEQIDAMAEAGKIQARCLQMLRSLARPGVTPRTRQPARASLLRPAGRGKSGCRGPGERVQRESLDGP